MDRWRSEASVCIHSPSAKRQDGRFGVGEPLRGASFAPFRSCSTFSPVIFYSRRPSPSTTNILSPVACTVCGLPAIELALALVLEFEPLERLLCGLTGVGR